MTQENGNVRTVAMLLGGVAAGIVGSRLLPPLIASVAGRVRGGGDPFTMLIDDHRQIVSTLEQMAEVPTDSKAQRARLFLMLKRKLAKHAMAEEDVVYPIVHGEAGKRDESKHLYEEHADMKILLYQLEEKLKSGEDWTSLVSTLTGIIRHHVDEEEQTVFPQLRERLAQTKRPKVSGLIAREEALVL